jgi:hypothetical protein
VDVQEVGTAHVGGVTRRVMVGDAGWCRREQSRRFMVPASNAVTPQHAFGAMFVQLASMCCRRVQQVRSFDVDNVSGWTPGLGALVLYLISRRVTCHP